MKKLLILAALVMFATSASATIIFEEDFVYPIGLLEPSSGGTWVAAWLAWGYPDWACVAEMAVADSIGMNATYAQFANPLPGINDAKVEFDFFLHEEGEKDLDPYVWFENNSHVIIEFQLDYSNNPGTGLLRVNNEFHGWTSIGAPIAVETWHTITAVLNQTVDPLSNADGDPDGTLDVYVDGVIIPEGPFSFKNNDLSGALLGSHVWRGTNTDPPEEDHDFIALDNIMIEGVPEPGTMALIGLGLLGLLRKRRKS